MFTLFMKVQESINVKWLRIPKVSENQLIQEPTMTNPGDTVETQE